MAMAQKYVKVMQSGYAIPIRIGSKLLMKCTTAESGFFNRKAFAKLDKLKLKENGSKLAGPASLTAHEGYAHLGLVDLVVWAQKEHSKALTCDKASAK
jgi:hypothetical protein